jgi:hypothetical protein
MNPLYTTLYRFHASLQITPLQLRTAGTSNTNPPTSLSGVDAAVLAPELPVPSVI